MEKSKKIISLLLALIMTLSVFTIVQFSAVAAETERTVIGATSGTTGDCTWTLDGTVLTISGNGKTDTYEYYQGGYNAPWGKEITKVNIKDGVTSIGDYAFYESDKLTDIVIPDSVTNIGRAVFCGCTALENIFIPDSVVRIQSSALKNTAWYDNQEDGLVYAGKVLY